MASWRALTSQSESIAEATTVVYDITAMLIFLIMAYTFLFPCNLLFPLDRRTMAVLAATLVYITRGLYFRDQTFNIIDGIDFDVLVLLASIMCINHLVVNQRETTKVILYVQNSIQMTPLRGFWLVSFITFVVSPFLTNDGVCLLFVQPICAAFDTVIERDKIAAKHINNNNEPEPNTKPKVLWPPTELRVSDILYFVLMLACSANIGSTLTYTGNPQNMVIAPVAQKVLSPIKFAGYMILPALVSWVMTTYFIQYCWKKERMNDFVEMMESYKLNSPQSNSFDNRLLEEGTERVENILLMNHSNSNAASFLAMSSMDSKGYSGNSSTSAGISVPVVQKDSFETELESKLARRRLLNGENNSFVEDSHDHLIIDSSANKLEAIAEIEVDSEVEADEILRKTRANRNISMLQGQISPQVRTTASTPVSPGALNRIARIVSSPIPYMVIVMLFAMIIMIFVDVMSITGLVCISALIMIVSVVIGNHWRGRPMLAPNGSHADDGFQQVSVEERTHTLNEFFDELFDSIDYCLIFIFLGTFVVVANLESTGIPKYLWNAIVGDIPFKTTGSVVGISLYVLLSSQLLGNVAVMQLAKPNVEILDENSKRFAWGIISFVATVGGNLTITGSAANIIVAEKCQRLVPNCKVDFFRHYKVCFWITILSCVIGGLIITVISHLDDNYGG